MQAFSEQHFRFADFELNGAKRLLLKQGKPLALSSKTFDLLLALVENQGKVLSREELLERVWPDQLVEEGNLTVQVSLLRKIFGEKRDEHRFIVTVPGRGYSFVAELDSGTDCEVVVESHSLSRIVIEEDESDRSDARRTVAKTIPAGRRLRIGVLLAAGLVLGSAAAAVGYSLYEGSQRSQQLAQSWINPTRAPKPVQLTTNGKVAFAALSPDGNHFAYTVGQTDKPSLWYAHVNGKQQIQIRPPTKGSYYGLTFAPDGTEIYYAADDEKDPNGALFRIPVLGGVPQKVLANVESPITFSPDGKRFAFVRAAPKRKLSFVVIADLANGANERIVATRPIDKRFTLRGASWSPDGRFIAVGTVAETALLEEEVALIELENGSVERYGTKTFQSVRRVAWLKDGSGLLVNAIEKDIWDDRHLWLIGYPDGNAHKITQDLFHYGMFNLSVSDDGGKILSVSSTKICNIFVSPADDLAEANKISANSLGKLPGMEGISWTSDGKIVHGAFFDNNRSLWTINADGSNARQLTTPGYLDRFPSVAKNNQYVVFNSTRGEGIWRIGIDGGGLKRLTTAGQRPDITPDGQWVLYGNRGEDGVISVWKVAIDGGEPVRLTYNPSGYVRVSPDGKMFACSSNAKDGEKAQLAVFPIAGGEPLHLFDLPAKANLSYGIRWATDGRSLAYRDFGPTLWKQDISGGEPKKLLEFPDEVIYSFDWSPDGRQFAIARGEDLRDVVLLRKDPE